MSKALSYFGKTSPLLLKKGVQKLHIFVNIETEKINA